jgi:hypothetical protein
MSDGASETVTLDEFFQLAFDAGMAEKHWQVPAVVTAYDKDAGTVGVTIPVNKMVSDGSGNFVSEPYPALKDIPIEWLRCGKYAITFPLEAGDTGILAVCDRPIGAWRTTGQAGDPGDVGTHTLDGAVFRPGLSSDARPPQRTSSTDMIIGTQSTIGTAGSGIIGIKSTGGGYLGNGATKGIARDGDGVSHGTMVVTAAMAGGVPVVTIVYTPGDGSAVQTVVSNAANTLTIHEKISGVSASWKCVD